MTDRLRTLGICLALCALTSCAGDDPTSAQPGGGPSEVPTTELPLVQDPLVMATDFAFTPTELTVPVGTEVTWRSNGGLPHTVTSGAGGFDLALDQRGAEASLTFSKVGRFAYVCRFHESRGMLGAIVVTP